MLTVFTTFHDKGHWQQFFIGKTLHNNSKILQSMLKIIYYYLKSKNTIQVSKQDCQDMTEHGCKGIPHNYTLI